MAAAATTPFIRSYSRILVASADSSFRKRLMKSPAYIQALSEEAVGGAHALAKLAQFPCDSVLLDRHLPDLDPAEVAELIRQRYPRTEVEFIDSRSDCLPQLTETDKACGSEAKSSGLRAAASRTMSRGRLRTSLPKLCRECSERVERFKESIVWRGWLRRATRLS